SAGKQKIELLDKSGKIQLEGNSKYEFIPPTSTNLDQAKLAFNKSDHLALLYVPAFELSKPNGITLYTKENPSMRTIEDLQGMLENRVHDLKLQQFNIDKETLKNLKTEISLINKNLN